MTAGIEPRRMREPVLRRHAHDRAGDWLSGAVVVGPDRARTSDPHRARCGRVDARSMDIDEEGAKKMNRLVLFILLMLFWVFLTWPADPPGPAYLQDLGTGVAVALLVTWIMGGTATEGLARWLEPKRYLWALAYVFVLAAYIVKANVEVAYRVLRPAMPIRPGIVEAEDSPAPSLVPHRT